MYINIYIDRYAHTHLFCRKYLFLYIPILAYGFFVTILESLRGVGLRFRVRGTGFETTALGGSRLVISRVISRITMVITYIRDLQHHL